MISGINNFGKLILTARAHLPVDVLVLKVPQRPGDRQGSVDALDHDGAAGVLYIVCSNGIIERRVGYL